VAETLGTAFLLMGVVGSGIMGESLAGGNTAIALLANAAATGCILYVLITTLGPISGAHFNPAVTLVVYLRGQVTAWQGSAYVVAQIAGGLIGVWATHLMFELSVFQLSQTERGGPALLLSEAIATFGLLFAIFGGLRHRPDAVPSLVALYIAGAYWFTSSTSFANPAVTIARSFSDTFAGIAPTHAPGFIVTQLVTAALTTTALSWLFAEEKR